MDQSNTVITVSDLRLSAHAIDRASLICRRIWQETRDNNEGLHSWLTRIMVAAVQNHPVAEDRYRCLGMILRFSRDANAYWLMDITLAKGSPYESQAPKTG